QRPAGAGPRLLDDPAVAQPHAAVGDRLGGRVVADDQRRAAALADELAEQRVHGRGRRGVELAGRLVREQQRRPVRERRAAADALLPTAGELPRPGAAAIAEPDALEQLVGGAFGLARVAAEQTELEPDRVAAREVGRERAGVVLVEQAEPLGAERGA